MSYTTFAYSNLRLSTTRISARDSLTVSVDVKNTGDRAGDEVLQLYLRDSVASVAEPVKSLKAFRRVTLQAGETRAVTFRLGADAFSLYDRQMRKVVEPGTFEVYVGGIKLSNGFGELTDPVEQRRRFESERSRRHRSGAPDHPIDERFLDALVEGMPPSGGNALGFDRLVALALGARRIADVMAFPKERL